MSISGIGGSSGFSGAAGLREIMQLRQQIIDKSQVLQQVHNPQAQATQTNTSGAPIRPPPPMKPARRRMSPR